MATFVGEVDLNGHRGALRRDWRSSITTSLRRTRGTLRPWLRKSWIIMRTADFTVTFGRARSSGSALRQPW
jgi:hypothetical protein